MRTGERTLDDLAFLLRQAYRLSAAAGGGGSELSSEFVDGWLDAVTNLLENEANFVNLSPMSAKIILGAAFSRFRDKVPPKFWAHYAKNLALLVPKFDDEQLVRTGHELAEMQEKLRMPPAFWDAFMERFSTFLQEKSDKLDLRANCIVLNAFRSHETRLSNSLKKSLVQRSFELLSHSNDAFELCSLMNFFERLGVRTDAQFTVEIRKCTGHLSLHNQPRRIERRQNRNYSMKGEKMKK